MKETVLIQGILESPDAERPYAELMGAYRRLGMNSCADAVAFLIRERWRRADGPDTREEQREDDRKDA